MDGPMGILDEGVEAMRAAWAGALPAAVPLGVGAPAFAGAPVGAGAQLASMSDAGLVRAVDAAGMLGRAVDALLAALAGEIARRSPREAGGEGLARRQGFASPAQLVAGATGGAFAGAARLVAVGAATAGRQSPDGRALPPRYPHVAGALRSGAVSVDAAGAITGMLDRVAGRARAEDVDRFERLLAGRAAGLPLDRLGRAIKDAEARLDPDGVRPREEELRAARSLTFRQDAHGMLRVAGALDPETGAPVMAAIQGIVTHALRAARDGGDGTVGGRGDGAGAAAGRVNPGSARGGAAGGADGGVDGADMADGRSIPQLQADALGMICRHALGCDRLPDAPAAAVIVRLDVKTLTEGLGHAEIDGLAQPVSAGTARRMAASAGVIPVVLGTESLPLDVGRASRGFTPAQRIALAERDGGCARCGLEIPYTEAHHIKWWVRDKGRTDLTNGVLLCQPCHTRIHNDGWTITVRSGQVWFTPPPHIDPDQKPRLGGKARYRVSVGPPRTSGARPPGRPGSVRAQLAEPGGAQHAHRRVQFRAGPSSGPCDG